MQPPINAPGQIPGSVFSNKTRTIPVKYKVESRTCTPGSSTVYPDTLLSDYPGGKVISTNLYWNAPSGMTVGQISNLTADFAWAQGYNHGGSLRWQIDTANGVTIYVYYGSTSDSFQSETGGSGVNMMAQTDARFEEQGGTPYLGTLSDVLSRPAPAGTIAEEPVSDIGLVVDSGWGNNFTATQEVTLQDATIVTSAGTSTYTPGTVSTDPNCTGWVSSNTAPAYLYLGKVSGGVPGAPIDEAIVNTQGDTGLKFRQVDGMYIYNLPLSQLTDLTATYAVGISFNSDGSNPLQTPVQFGLK